ncbi:MAG: indolepyruvate ferredoxin oxidoreductase family protein [Alphaproteobacteria bacterium]|jgi:indolepyruvate ferredoxin oxidoreductase|nr:indolepyruvate ferredoxin oxidoreductase family protein [Alphaproteobacteria bacterium]
MTLAAVSLDDKYTLEQGRVYLTGVQALVRLPMLQRQRDVKAGLNTGGFISGYRGSPVGGYDQQLWRAKEFLKRNHIHFQPGVNEDLAATAIWGSQQSNLFPDSKFDGVFAYWYGKGPGVDRCGDVFKHGNMAGPAKHGGVLLIAGDDHAAKSSTVPHQSEYAFVDASIPVLNPAGVQEILDYGILGMEMSRYTGCWVAFKTTAENMDSSSSIDVDPERIKVALPDMEMPEGGLNIRWPDDWMEQERRLHRYKLNAVRAFGRANGFDRTIIEPEAPKLGIVTTGKSYLDTRQAMEELGITEEMAAAIGIRLYKVGMPWPLEPEGASAFADGVEEILVIEEKRALIESQLKEQLYHADRASQPRIVGKLDETGAWMLPSSGELNPTLIARVIAARIARFHQSPTIEDRLKFLDAKEAQLIKPKTDFARTPYFCSGCPHNTSTRVPEGSRATAGIGCHFMSVWMDRSTSTYTHMGGEGTPWIGQAPFTDTKHIFANLGDGTYTHSGLLAIRAAGASGVNITYKILYNDATAMTGGQPTDGGFTVPQVAAQVAAEGANDVRIVTDEPDKYPIGTKWPDGTRIHHRDELDSVQKELREVEGLSVLIYDQTCAAEKRRRRKRGTMIDPPKRIFINELVCEGCGDCGVASNCVSVAPVETEYGRKRGIDQSACNKDYSCTKGFCPSFVNVIGGKVRKSKAVDGASAPDLFEVLPEPEQPKLDQPYGVMVTGIGGTGVVTIGALMGMAAHIEGKGVSVLDMTGLAQKGGAVISHIRIAKNPEDLHAVRIAAGSAKLMLACDMVTAASVEGLSKVSKEETTAIVNTQQTMTGAFTRDPDLKFPGNAFEDAIKTSTGENSTHFVDATRIATQLMGDSIAANLFMMGYALQKGQIPLSLEAVERAIELNAVAVDFNKQALLWGRRAAHDLATVERIATPPAPKPVHREIAGDLEEMIEKRVAFLTAYQDKAYADRYVALVRDIETAERNKTPGLDGLTEAVARYAFKLMAYKDEYEVARLYTDGTFQRQLADQFEGDYKIEFNLAPPLFSQRDPETGHLKKKIYGAWMMTAFKLLAKMKGLRGTTWDIFGRTEERRAERQLIEDYVTQMKEVAGTLDRENHAAAVDLAKIPELIRGFGHVKDRHLMTARARQAQALTAFRDPEATKRAAE